MRNNLHKTTAINYTGIGVLNVFLLATAIFLMMYFVIVSNVITSSNYRIGLLSKELSELTEINGVMTAQKLSIEDSSIILNFAQSHYMVQATDITHIFESSNVAAR